MRRKWIAGLVVVALCMLTATQVVAGGTKLISYQGRVTRADGSAVADGTYLAVFSFYTTSTGGVLLWSESSSVTTTGGLFTHILGSIVPIADTLFPANGEVWLDVVFNGQQQVPRTQFLAATYALRVNTVDGAQGGTVTDSIVVTPTTVLKRTPGGVATTDMRTVIGATSVAFYEPLDSKSLSMVGSKNPVQVGTQGLYLLETRPIESFGLPHTRLQPHPSGDGGYLVIGHSNSAVRYFEVDGNSDLMGNPSVTIAGSSGQIQFYPGGVGTNTVKLPDSAIDAAEIKDEPGIALRHDSYFVTLNNTSMTPIDSVTITIPSDGYIVVEGSCTVQRWGTTGANFEYFQIDSSWGGTYNWPDYVIVGSYEQPGTGNQFASVTATETFYRPAGSYTFYFEGMGHNTLNAPGWGAQAIFPVVRATFFPTSYGSIISAVSQNDGGGFSSKVALTPQASALTPAPSQGVYSVDLRELELKAAQARAEAAELERRLAEARLQEQVRSASARPAVDK